MYVISKFAYSIHQGYWWKYLVSKNEWTSDITKSTKFYKTYAHHLAKKIDAESGNSAYEGSSCVRHYDAEFRYQHSTRLKENYVRFN